MATWDTHAHAVALSPFQSRPPSALWMIAAPVVGPCRGPYALFSNMAPTPVFGYPTSEHAYVAAKTLDVDVRAVVRVIASPVRAKAYGGRARDLLLLRPEESAALLGDLATPPGVRATLARQAVLEQLYRAPPFVMRPAWEATRLDVMGVLLVEKWRRHPAVRTLLEATGDAPICEINTWGDVFWGVTPTGIGANWLGRTWGAVRAAARAGVLTPA